MKLQYLTRKFAIRLRINTVMDNIEKIRGSLDKWLESGEMDVKDFLETADEHWESFINSEFSKIEDELKTDPEKAYSHLVSLANFTGHAAHKKPRIIRVLSGFIRRFIDVMRKLKTALGAGSFSVTVSFPFDLSLTLTFS